VELKSVQQSNQLACLDQKWRKCTVVAIS
jgi:hypothetical protein